MRQKRRKYVIMLLLTILLILSFTACGKKKVTEEETIIPTERIQMTQGTEVQLGENTFTTEYETADDILFEIATLNQGQLPTIRTDDDGKIVLIQGVLSDQRIENEGEALLYLESISKLFGIQDAEHEYVLESVHETNKGKQYVFIQRIPNTEYSIAGAGFYIITENGIPVCVSGCYYDTSVVNTDASFTLQELTEKLEAKTGFQYQYICTEVSLITIKDRPVPCLVDVFTEYGEEEARRTIVDSATGEILEQTGMVEISELSVSDNLSDAYGNAISIQVELEDGKYLLKDTTRAPYIEIRLGIDNEETKYGYSGPSGWLDTRLHRNNVLYGAQQSYPQDIIGFYEHISTPIVAEDKEQFSESIITLMDSYEKIYDAYTEVLGHQSMDGDGQFPLLIYIDSGNVFGCSTLPSADPKKRYITINENHGYLYGDIVALVHEYQHGITANIAGNGMTNPVGEAYSDIFGCLMEGYIEGDTDWIVADYVNPYTGQTGNGMRSIQNCADYNSVERKTKYLTDFKYYERGDAEGLNYYCISTIFSHTAYLIYEGVSGQQGFKDLYEKSEAYVRIMKLYYDSLHYLQFESCSDSEYMERAAAAVCKLATDDLGMSQEEKEIVLRAFLEVNLDETEYIASESLMSRIEAYIVENGLSTNHALSADYGALFDEECTLEYGYDSMELDYSNAKKKTILIYESITFDNFDLEPKVKKLHFYKDSTVEGPIETEIYGGIVTDQLSPLMERLYQYIMCTVLNTKEFTFEILDDDRVGKVEHTFWQLEEGTPIEQLDEELRTMQFDYDGYTYTFVTNGVEGVINNYSDEIDMDNRYQGGIIRLRGMMYRK